MGKVAANMVGKRFGSLTVVELNRVDRSNRFWLCQCECGNQRECSTGQLNRGATVSCGCLRKAHNRKDLTGQKFGRLAVVEQAPSRPHCGTVLGFWLCRCECGTQVEVPTTNLVSGNSKSCGCLAQERKVGNTYGFKFIHGHNNRNSATYRSWTAMWKRCRDSENVNYGGRGILVDPRWENFETFLADMGERPEGHTIDRIDNAGPYSPENCRWATQAQQLKNRRVTRWLTYQGKTQTVAEWARELGLHRNVVYGRLDRGWSIEAALQPVSPRQSLHGEERTELSHQAAGSHQTQQRRK